MSGKEKRPQTSSKAGGVVATILVAAAAIAAIIVLVIINKKSETESKTLPDGTTVSYDATTELYDECGEEARRLMADNYKMIRLFITEGLPHLDEPYGNRPDDGFYTVDSEDYKTYEQLESFVKSVYTEQEAERILTKMPSDPAVTYGGVKRDEDTSVNTSEKETPPEYIAVYNSRDVYVDIENSSEETSKPKVPNVVVPDASAEGEESDAQNVEDAADVPSDDTYMPDANTGEFESSESSAVGAVESHDPTYTKQSVLGINEFFVPYTEYNRLWSSISIKVVPSDYNECFITVYLGADRDVDLSSVDDSDVISTKMVKENGAWKLTELVY